MWSKDFTKMIIYPRKWPERKKEFHTKEYKQIEFKMSTVQDHRHFKSLSTTMNEIPNKKLNTTIPLKTIQPPTSQFNPHHSIHMVE